MNVALCRYANEWPNVPVTFTLERNPMTSQLYQKVVALELLLRQHEESNRIRGVTATREALDQGDLEGAKTTYRAMLGGAGSFADLNFWHDNFETRRKLNEPLDSLRDGIWDAFGL